MTIAIDLEGRTCLVVGGAGGGIGSAMSLAAAAAGAPVGIVTHNPSHLDEIVAQLDARGARSAAVVADVYDEDALVRAIARIGDELGTIRHLVNVIGGATGTYQRVAEFTMENFEGLLSRNVRYAIVACREVAKPLIDRAERGSIVNISSGASQGSSLLGGYSAAKAALEAFSRTMALEWGHRGIRVNVVSCGSIRTPRTGFEDVPDAVRSIPLRRRGDAEEAAVAAMFLLSDLAGYTTGHVLTVDGGVSLGGPGGEDLPAIVVESERAARARRAP